MTITTTKCGVFFLDDTYKKIASAYWSYKSISATEPGEFWAWGFNYNGQLGTNNRTGVLSPVQVPGTNWVNVAASLSNVIATKCDGTLWGWGCNIGGELAQNNTTQRSSPVQIPGTSWNKVEAGRGHILATKTDGTLWAWGSGGNGNIGNNAVCTSYSSPIQVPGTSWNCITGGLASSLATKTDGTLWAWGQNLCGNLGQNNIVDTSSPVQIPGTSWTGGIAAGCYTGFAIKSNGTLWSWGYGQIGQLGQNCGFAAGNSSSPVQVPGTTWVEIQSEEHNAMARKTDGTLWVWGRNTSGALANDIPIFTCGGLSSPTQIPGTNWVGMAIRNGCDLVVSMYARKNDGTLWSWGDNFCGVLGVGDSNPRSSPVQIPGSNWSDIDSAYFSAYAKKI